MNQPTSVAAADRPVPMAAAVPSEARPPTDKESTASQHSKLHVHVDADAERMRSMLVRIASNSVDELEGLVSELQEVREFLKSESERVQREITNYAQLNRSTLTAIKIITETIGPWKSTAMDNEGQNSGTEPVIGERRTQKAASGANK